MNPAVRLPQPPRRDRRGKSARSWKPAPPSSACGALRRLIELRAERELARCLASTDPAVVQLAIAGLWECWLDEAGPEARRTMEAGVEAMHAGDLTAAKATFKR